MRLESPWLLLLLLLVPVVAWLLARRARTAPLRFSSLLLIEPVGRSWRQRMYWILPMLRLLAVIAIIIALARPQEGSGEVETRARGVAMMMVVDRSASMAEPMSFEGRRLARIDVVKQVFQEFVVGNEAGLPGRREDLIGLVTFAGVADTICPLVRIHDALVKLVRMIRLASSDARSFDAGTAIGEGLALAAARLDRAEEDIARDEDIDEDFEIKSKVIVLLTDGGENRGEVNAREAAAKCAELGIKIYAIGIGESPQSGRGPALIFGTQSFDEVLLKDLAQATGGVYFRAGDGEALRRVYERIDELEKTEIESIEYTSYDESFSVYATAAGIVLLLEFLLAHTIFRRNP